jgi:hypothetical protein
VDQRSAVAQMREKIRQGQALSRPAVADGIANPTTRSR